MITTPPRAYCITGLPDPMNALRQQLTLALSPWQGRVEIARHPNADLACHMRDDETAHQAAAAIAAACSGCVNPQAQGAYLNLRLTDAWLHDSCLQVGAAAPPAVALLDASHPHFPISYAAFRAQLEWAAAAPLANFPLPHERDLAIAIARAAEWQRTGRLCRQLLTIAEAFRLWQRRSIPPCRREFLSAMAHVMFAALQ